jgi:CheY-like chemotaxis protein
MQVLELPIILLAVGFGLEIAIGVGIALQLFSERTRRKSSTASNARDPMIVSDTPFTPRAVTTTVLHDLHAPIQMILGYCDIMLNPANSHRTPLPDQFKTDIISIERNARQLGILIDQCFIEEQPTQSLLLPAPAIAKTTTTIKNPAPESIDHAGRQTILVLNRDPLAAEWLHRHMPLYNVVWKQTIAELGRVSPDSLPIALVITEVNESGLPEIAAIVGDGVPILKFVLPGTREAAQLARGIHSLIKPVTYEVLAVELAGFETPIRDVLIVDDDQDNVELIGRMLSDIDVTYTVRKAYSGREGLALMREQIPGVVILDLRLPDLSGLTIVHYMRTVPQLAQVPIMLVSATHVSEMPTLSLPTVLCVSRLRGFSYDELGRLLEALTAINASAK